MSNSSRAASRRSIRRLIVLGFLLGRGTAPGRLRFLGPKVGTLTAVNGIYYWDGLFAIACTEKQFHKQFKQLPTVAEHTPSGFFINQPIVNDPVHQVVRMHELEPTPVSQSRERLERIQRLLVNARLAVLETVAAKDMIARFAEQQGRDPDSVVADATYGNGEFLTQPPLPATTQSSARRKLSTLHAT